MTDRNILTNQCDVCGKPATQWMSDPWGKSSVTRPKCAEHGLRLRDPADVAEIEQLRANAIQAVRLLAAVEFDGQAYEAIGKAIKLLGVKP